MKTIANFITEMMGDKSEWTRKCPHCGCELLTLRGLLAQGELEEAGDRTLSGLSVECQCEQARADRLAAAEEQERAAERARAEERRKQMERRFNGSYMPEAWRERGLAMWQTPDESQQAAMAAAVRFLKEAIRDGGRPRSLFISGGVGTGKTMLASCLARELHRKLKWCIFCNMGDVLGELRSCYAKGLSAEDALRRYKKSAYLVLDDLGKERPTEWATEQLYLLINHRYENALPTIVTTNYGRERLVQRLTPVPFGGMDPDPMTALAIVDRLREMCDMVLLNGESWRGNAR